MNILVTGSDGLLGSTLILVLGKKGYRVNSFEGNICNIAAIDRYKGRSFDWIIHTAAITNVDSCEKDTRACFNSNVLGTRNIVGLAKNTASRLMYISTVSVFSGEKGDYKETDVPYPKNFYNLSKLLGEEAVRGYDKGTILRLNLIGIHPQGSRGRNFLEWLIDAIRINKDIDLFTDVRVNPLSNWTVAECIAKYIELGIVEKLMHIGSSTVLSKADIGAIVIGKVKFYKGAVSLKSIEEVAHNGERPKEMWLNAARAEQILGFVMPTLREEIENIFIKNNVDL